MSAPRRPARLKDVADLAGVSLKTVSNVVHDYPFVRAETRARVQDAINELGYQPNLAARRLRNGRTGVIALAVPQLTAPYFAELAHHIAEAARRHDWTVVVDETGQTDDPVLRERERLAAAGIRREMVDGVILSPLALTEDDLQRYGAVPVVLLGERLGPGLADQVVIDNRAAARELAAHLLATGRRRIAVVGDQQPPFGHTARQRLDGFSQALAEAGLALDPSLVRDAPAWDRETGRRVTAELLDLAEPPDAVFCLNDLLALGAIRALHERGVRVPSEVAVVGFDDIEESRFAVPALTTIAPDKAAIAKAALDRLAGRLAAPEQWRPEEIRVPHRLVVRESSNGGLSRTS